MVASLQKTPQWLPNTLRIVALENLLLTISPTALVTTHLPLTLSEPPITLASSSWHASLTLHLACPSLPPGSSSPDVLVVHSHTPLRALLKCPSSESISFTASSPVIPLYTIQPLAWLHFSLKPLSLPGQSGWALLAEAKTLTCAVSERELSGVLSRVICISAHNFI